MKPSAKGTSVGVWGLGKEGLAAVAYLLAGKSDDTTVIAVDERLEESPAGLPANVRFLGGPDALKALLSCSTVIVGPGVPRVHLFRSVLENKGIALETGTSLWMEKATGDVIGVTGTKGKSTTASLIEFLLEKSDLTPTLAGNIGTPLLTIDETAPLVVAELSSYQCAYLKQSPRIAVVTNLFEDHLPWHGSKGQYWRDKSRLFANGAGVLITTPETLEKIQALGVSLPAQVLTTDDPRVQNIDTAPLPDALSAPHIRENLKLAVLASIQITGFEWNIYKASLWLSDFRGLPHRLEEVSRAGRRTWVDDTLSTTAESVVAAIRSFPGRELTLIIGGQDRGIDYSPVNDELLTREPRVNVVCLPDNGNRIVDVYAQTRSASVHYADDMALAVQTALDASVPDSVVVLSPGAPSQNVYKNYEEKSADYITAIASLYSAIAIDESLSLRQLQLEDAPRLFELTDTNRDHLGKFLPWVPLVTQVADSEAHIRETLENRAKGTIYTYGITHDGEIIGNISLRNINDPERTEIGYWIGKEYGGRGIITAAVNALTDFGMKTLELSVIRIRAVPDNTASNKVAEKAGYTFVGLVHDEKHHDLNVWECRRA